ncbi:hypothetical protein AVEN_13547-1 [Araneus ventricosus]|uniref:Uncharacterized protein n=1 Tax=Araneus ventricosus TaxID=182803 RepID=A0A4Y2D5Q2_ARAVE|nr:hypothetical protein AVEN_13547-1 [Araneus ventricosus]
MEATSSRYKWCPRIPPPPCYMKICTKYLVRHCRGSLHRSMLHAETSLRKKLPNISRGNLAAKCNSSRFDRKRCPDGRISASGSEGLRPLFSPSVFGDFADHTIRRIPSSSRKSSTTLCGLSVSSIKVILSPTDALKILRYVEGHHTKRTVVSKRQQRR